MRGLVLWKIWNITKWTNLQSNVASIYIIMALNIIMADIVLSLRITSMTGPSMADPRYDSPQMTCQYEYGEEGLFTVKWYKDDREFYRYLPNFDPQIIRFPTDDVALSEDGWIVTETTLEKRLAAPEICNTTSCTIQLVNLTSLSVGVYACEISSERPLYFKTGIRSINLTLVAPPNDPPVIHGRPLSYSIGDRLSATCTSDASLPPSKIDWMINGETVPSDSIMYSSDIQVSKPNKFGLGRSMSQLDLTLEEDHIVHSQRGQLNVTCLASLPDTNISKSSHVLFPLAGSQGMMNDNQKLEWNSNSGERNIDVFVSLSTAALFTIFKLMQYLLCN